MYQKLLPIELAANELNLEFNYCDPDKISAKVRLKEQDYYFVNYITPFNSESVAKIMKDKFLTYLLLKDKVIVPQTKAYYSPFIRDEYKDLVKFSDIEQIIDDIVKSFTFPVVVKMNSGKRKRNFKVCKSINEIKVALEAIFSGSRFHDFIALAQEFIEIKEEYRVIVFNGKILLVYDKGTYSELHDYESITELVKEIHEIIPLGFCGLDIAINKKNEPVLIELNSQPRFEPYQRKNGLDKVSELYKSIFLNIL